MNLDVGTRPERLFDPGGRTLDDVLREMDDALRHGRAAACLVCGAMTTVGGDLSTPAGWTDATYSYNHSAEYVQSVYAATDRIAAASHS